MSSQGEELLDSTHTLTENTHTREGLGRTNLMVKLTEETSRTLSIGMDFFYVKKKERKKEQNFTRTLVLFVKNLRSKL